MNLLQRFLTTSSVVIFGISGVHAQDKTPTQDLQRFQSEAGQYAALFRGHQETRYASAANGHQYWESPYFKNGDIVFEGRLYKDVQINFDALKKEVLVMSPDRAFISAIDWEDVSRFSMEDSQFVNSVHAGLNLPDGIYEILHEGPECTLYMNVAKELNSSPNSVNGSEIGYDDPNYKPNVLTYFAYKSKLYLKKNGQDCVVIKNKRALRRQFPSRKKEISKIVDNLERPSLRVYCKVILNQIDK